MEMQDGGLRQTVFGLPVLFGTFRLAEEFLNLASKARAKGGTGPQQLRTSRSGVVGLPETGDLNEPVPR